MDRLLALKDLVHDAVDATTRVIEEGNASTGRTVERATRLLPDRAGAWVRGADWLRGTITDGVLASVRGVNRLVAFLSDAALAAAPLPASLPEPPPLDAEALHTPEAVVDQLIALLNAVVGDHLRRAGNALDLGMSFRPVVDAAVEADVADPRATWVVMVHGLGTTDLCWSLDAEEQLGDPRATLGTRVAEAVGGVVRYVRYNGGVAVQTNGRLLAELIQSELDAFPVPVERVILVGHSMGGLVARAAAHHGRRTEMGWRSHLSHVVTIGTPHLGAPLAEVGHTAAVVLSAVDLPATRVLGMILDGRSEGIQDLRRGDPDTLGTLGPDVTWVFLSGSLRGDADGLVGRTLGDLLVTVRSAHGPEAEEGAFVHTHHVDGVLHQTVQTDARVVDEVVRAVTSEP